MNYIIRDLEERDIDRIMEIEAASFTTSWSRQQFVFELKDNPLASYIVMEVKGQPVAYAGIWVILDEAHITTIAVDPAYRGQGAGDGLMYRLLEISREMGLNSLTLEVRQSNLVAKSLYRKYGFLEAGLRKGYYQDTQEDGIIMVKNLRQGE